MTNSNEQVRTRSKILDYFRYLIDNGLLQKMSGAAVKTLVVLLRHRNYAGKARLKLETIQKETGLSRRPVEYALKEIRSLLPIRGQKKCGRSCIFDIPLKTGAEISTTHPYQVGAEQGQKDEESAFDAKRCQKQHHSSAEISTTAKKGTEVLKSAPVLSNGLAEENEKTGAEISTSIEERLSMIFEEGASQGENSQKKEEKKKDRGPELSNMVNSLVFSMEEKENCQKGNISRLLARKKKGIDAGEKAFENMRVLMNPGRGKKA